MKIVARRRQSIVRPAAAATLLALATCAGVVVAAPPGGAATVPTMARTFHRTEAPTPGFLSSAGGRLALTQQTVAGLAQQKYGETAGLTALQAAAARSGMLSSLGFPTSSATTQSVVASAVGVLATHNSTPESASAPGCTTNEGGSVSRVTITRSGTTYRLAVTTPQRDGFAPAGSWQLPTRTSGGPKAVTVLDPNCGFDGASVVAVTYASGVDFYDYTGNAATPFGAATGAIVSPSGSWLPGGTVLASAHVNADASYVPVQPHDPDSDNGTPTNAVFLALTSTKAGSTTTLTLHRVKLVASPAGGNAPLLDAQLTVESTAVAPSSATLAYDNNASRVSDVAIATRTGSQNAVWFGEIADGANTTPPTLQSAQACAGTALPRLAVADALVGDYPFTGVACTVPSGSHTIVQRWSNYTTADGGSNGFPLDLHSSRTILPALTAARPFVTWPCVLLNEYSDLEQLGAPSCLSDIAADVVGTPAKQAPRLYALPALGGRGTTISRALAGGRAGAAAVVDALPLDPSTITVVNSSEQATLTTSAPTPLVYLMPAPMVSGLVQPVGGPPVSFGTSHSAGHGGSTSFTTSVGATVGATIGEPSIAAADLSVSAEQAVGRSHEQTSEVSTSQSVNDNGNEPLVVYTVTPQWRWTGTVTADSSGLGVSNHAKVVTTVAVNDASHPTVLAADSVAQLGSRYAAFRRGGTYSATLTSVFGAGVFGGSGRTVADADPSMYPGFTPGHRTPMWNGARYCDSYSGSRGVAAVNSGVPSPYTPADSTAGGPQYLLGSDAPHTVAVGDSASDSNSVSITSAASNSYSTDFTVSASAGVSVGGVSVSADAGFSIGNQTSVTTSKSQTFSVEIGHIKGASGTSLPASLRTAIDRALTRSETYTWEPFICHRTTTLPGGGQTSALVLGFATYGFTGLADVGAPGVPTHLSGSASRSTPTKLAQRGTLAFDRTGTAAAYRVAVQHLTGRAAATVTTAVTTPAQAARVARRLDVRLPTLAAGTYRWHVGAVSFNGGVHTSGWHYFRVS